MGECQAGGVACSEQNVQWSIETVTYFQPRKGGAGGVDGGNDDDFGGVFGQAFQRDGINRREGGPVSRDGNENRFLRLSEPRDDFSRQRCGGWLRRFGEKREGGGKQGDT